MDTEPQAIESPGLEIAIDRDAEVPIGTQLAWALRARIRDGTFRPEQRLPGLRELAQATGVNVNTIRTLEHGHGRAPLRPARRRHRCGPNKRDR